MIEKMGDFFDARVDGYEAHMMENVVGADVYYKETAMQFPRMKEMRLLDLGCGTGLELDELFRRMPDMKVTGVDLSGKMLDRLRRKHADRDMTLIQGDYFDVPLDDAAFDAAVAVQTMHHFRDAEKIRLFRKILRSLRPGGLYIQTDYTATDEAEERAMLAEADRLLAGQKEDGLYHIDIPFTVEHELRLLKEAGFSDVEMVWRTTNTAVIRAKKREKADAAAGGFGKMKIAMGSDHVGYEMKQVVRKHLEDKGYECVDYGSFSSDRCDYPVYGEKVGRAVASGECELGVLICGTGIGISLAANRVVGVRAAVCSEPYSARLTREHNNANIIAFGARVVGEGTALDIVDAFFGTEFQGGRHAERVALLEAIERN